MKRVLITGGAGAIGCHVIAEILEKTDWHIVVLDSFRHKGYKDRLDVVITDTNRVEIIQHDLACPISPELKEQIGSVNYILHLAALSDVFFSVENPVYVLKNNIDSSITMYEYAKNTPHEAFIYFSTDEVYGAVAKGQAHKEWDTMMPSNAYSASKACGELIGIPYWRKGEVNLIITNTMNNFAPMQAPSKFPAMVQQLVKAGKTVPIHGNEKEVGTRFYIHSRDTASALLHILNNKPPFKHKLGEIDRPDKYHIVGDKALSNLELAQMISELMGEELNYELIDFHKDNPAHDIHYGLEDNKLRPEWKPQPVEKGLKDTIDWQQEHQEWMR